MFSDKKARRLILDLAMKIGFYCRPGDVDFHTCGTGSFPDRVRDDIWALRRDIELLAARIGVTLETKPQTRVVVRKGGPEQGS